MLVEGLYYAYPGVPQDPDGTAWLLGQLDPVKQAGKPIYIVDYLDPAQGGTANQVAQQIAQLGLAPLVVPPTLDGTVLAPLPPLRIEKCAFKSGVTAITFTALKGKPYSVERTASIKSGSWVKITDVAAPTTTSIIEVKDSSGTGSLHFYRLATP